MTLYELLQDPTSTVRRSSPARDTLGARRQGFEAKPIPPLVRVAVAGGVLDLLHFHSGRSPGNDSPGCRAEAGLALRRAGPVGLEIELRGPLRLGSSRGARTPGGGGFGCGQRHLPGWKMVYHADRNGHASRCRGEETLTLTGIVFGEPGREIRERWQFTVEPDRILWRITREYWGQPCWRTPRFPNGISAAWPRGPGDAR